MTDLDVILTQINEETVSYSRPIIEGKAHSFDEYARLCGILRGLAIAKDIIITLKDRIEEE